MPTRRGTWSQPYVDRDPHKGQGEIPGAEQSASERNSPSYRAGTQRKSQIGHPHRYSYSHG
eukprot:4545481-Prymnesium_polylepis.1